MPTPEDRRRAEELFEATLQVPPAERDSFIERECTGRPALAREVRLLLRHYEAAPADFLQSPTAGFEQSGTPDTIGPYELNDVLGEGGMGVVYRAEQREPVARTVAVKILKPGMDSREILARFESERQVLARLEHPNIARVYDAGTLPDSRPYFVMEYVRGQSITSYCDARRLTPRERIELFVELCRGVQYAHQQGIIHRDLKPMNILVTERAGVAVPKVIDFGVAKAVQQGLTEATLFTRLGQLIGTPEYMSPEQAEAAPVDTRSDVYSLGVVLYELLVGSLPIDAAELRRAGAAAMMRLIREQEPPRPSTRAGGEDESTTTAAARRSVEPRVLARTLRGELDWIALKALEKDPERRYPTVGELAADLQRHLADEPVSARPAGKGYLLGKFVRRHRVGVGLALTIGLAVTTLAVSMTWQARRIARERDRANHEAAVSQQVKDFLMDVFEVSDPGEARGNSVSAREILDRGAARIDGIEDAAVRAELTRTLGAVYHNLGLYSQSDSLFIQAKDLWMEIGGLDHPQTLQALLDVGGVYSSLGRHALAESTYALAIEGWRDLGRSGDRTALLTSAKLATVYRMQGRYAQAESLYVDSVERLRRLDGHDDYDVLSIRANLAFCYSIWNREDDAAAIYEDVLARQRRAQGGDDPQTLRIMNSLAAVYRKQDRLDEAAALLAEVLEGKKRVLGEEHPDYVSAVEGLAGLYFEREDHARAVPLYERVLVARRRILGDEHPSTIVTLHNLAATNYELGNLEDAELLAREALRLRLRTIGDEHPYTRQTRYLVALILVRRGILDEALAQLRTAVDHGFAHPVLLSEESLEVLAPLRDRPGFEAILDSVRVRIEESNS